MIEIHPDADLAAVRQWVHEFSVATTMPSLLEEFDRIVSRVRARRQGG